MRFIIHSSHVIVLEQQTILLHEILDQTTSTHFDKFYLLNVAEERTKKSRFKSHTDLKLFKMSCRLVELYALLALELSISTMMVQCSDETVAKYVSSLIASVTIKDCSKYHDVTLIRIEQESNSGIFDSIAQEVVKNNPENPVFIHSSNERIPAYRVHSSSLFVITTDFTDEVFIY